MDYRDGGVRLSTPATWQVACDLCGREGTQAASRRVAELGFEVHGDQYLCAECSNQLAGRGAAPLPPQDQDPTEVALIEALLQHYPEGELDLSPGSVMRSLITTTATCINRVQFDQEQQAIQNHLHETYAADAAARGMGGAFFEGVVTRLAEQATQAQAHSREAIVREFVQRLESGSAQPSFPQMSHPLRVPRDTTQIANRMVEVQPLPSPAEVFTQSEMIPEPETRWERLLRDDPFG